MPEKPPLSENVSRKVINDVAITLRKRATQAEDEAKDQAMKALIESRRPPHMLTAPEQRHRELCVENDAKARALFDAARLIESAIGEDNEPF